MPEPKVLNLKWDKVPPGAVYVGRPTKWGNPFKVTPERGNVEAVKLYRDWITRGLGRYLLVDLHELRGKELVCWCAPLPCHADVLLELANKR